MASPPLRGRYEATGCNCVSRGKRPSWPAITIRGDNQSGIFTVLIWQIFKLLNKRNIFQWYESCISLNNLLTDKVEFVMKPISHARSHWFRTSLFVFILGSSSPVLALHSWVMDFIPAQVGGNGLVDPASGSWIGLNGVILPLTGSASLRPGFTQSGTMPGGGVVLSRLDIDPIFNGAFIFQYPLSQGSGNDGYADEAPGVYPVDFSAFEVFSVDVNGSTPLGAGAGTPGLLSVVSATGLDPADSFEIPVPMFGAIDYSFSAGGSNFSFHLTTAAVPLPAAFWFFVSGLLLLGGYRRR